MQAGLGSPYLQCRRQAELLRFGRSCDGGDRIGRPSAVSREIVAGCTGGASKSCFSDSESSIDDKLGGKLSRTYEHRGRAVMADKVTVVDVTVRDGLQNEPKLVSTQDKLTLIEKLVQAGVSHIQATSFVPPAWVPQLADAEARSEEH